MLTKYKIVFLGDQGVGKTSLITRFMYDTFDPQYAATIGIDFLSKTMYLDDKTVRLQLWDTAGQERFRSLIPSYIRDSNVAIITYDITSKESFEALSQWCENVQNERGDNVIICIVGNKSDLTEKRLISTEQGEASCKELGAQIFIETSTKNGYNVKQLFKKVAQLLPDLNNPKEEEPEQPQVIDVSAGGESTNEGNCQC